jgi:hypothetical protein
MALLVYWDNGVESSYIVGSEPVIVGRATECAIRTADGRVSRNHARFYLDQMGTLYVEDLGSSNGVYVGTQRVQHSAVPLNELVVIGGLTFRLVPYGAHAPQPPPVMSWPQPDTQPVALVPHASAHGDAYGATAAYQPYPAAYPAAYPAPHAAPPMPQQPPQQQAAPPVYQPPQQPPQQLPHAPAPNPAAPPSRAKTPSESPSVQIDWNADVDVERKARLAAETERDAYAARLAALHQELRALTQELEITRRALDAAHAELARSKDAK